MKTSTYFALLAEFGTSEIPLSAMADKYFGLDAETAFRRAGLNRLPVPAYRAGSQKSPWLVSAAILAEHIDRQSQAAKDEWEKSRAA